MKNFALHRNFIATLPCKTNMNVNVTTLFYSAMQNLNKT